MAAIAKGRLLTRNQIMVQINPTLAREIHALIEHLAILELEKAAQWMLRERDGGESSQKRDG